MKPTDALYSHDLLEYVLQPSLEEVHAALLAQVRVQAEHFAQQCLYVMETTVTCSPVITMWY